MAADGDLLVVKLGAGQDTEDIRLRYNAARARHIQTTPILAVRSIDQIGAHLDAGIAATTKQYVPLNNAPPFNDYFSPRHIPEAYAAGLSLEYRHAAWLAGGATQASVGTYFYEYDDAGEMNTPDGQSNAVHTYTIPPTGGVAETAYLHGGGLAGERVYVESGWLPLRGLGDAGAPAFTKQSFYPGIYMFEDAGGDKSSLVFNYRLWLRWVTS